MIKVAIIHYVTTYSITVIKEWQQIETLFTCLKETKYAVTVLCCLITSQVFTLRNTNLSTSNI